MNRTSAGAVWRLAVETGRRSGLGGNADFGQPRSEELPVAGGTARNPIVFVAAGLRTGHRVGSHVPDGEGAGRGKANEDVNDAHRVRGDAGGDQQPGQVDREDAHRAKRPVVLVYPLATPAQFADRLVKQYCDEHCERNLLAFVYGYLGEHDLLRVRTDAEKYLLLAVLNLVECIAFVGDRPLVA